MDETGDLRASEATAADSGFGGWILFWVQLIVLGLLAILGAAFASADAAPGDNICGLLLALAAIALAFMRLKNRFDAGGTTGWAGYLLVDDMANLVAVIVIFVVVALAGLFVAASYDHGGLHDAGVALFVVSGVAVFASLKHVFDAADRRR
ncbi:MAG: hypothetical protein ACM3JG_12125 [Thiohalocapsa sp.]